MQADAATVAELEQLRNEPSPLVAAQQRLTEHSLDAEKFEKLIENLQVGPKDGDGRHCGRGRAGDGHRRIMSG